MYKPNTEKKELEENPSDIMGLATDVLAFAGPAIAVNLGLSYWDSKSEEDKETQMTTEGKTADEIEVAIAHGKLLPSIIKCVAGVAGFAGVYFFGNKLPEWGQKMGYGASTGVIMNGVQGFVEIGTVKKSLPDAYASYKKE